uniref:Uncharacterized protein n=1 Tax=Knipowitschia caucasica TaxID=637954 RepID=A0AAV2MPC0_KNICA
MWVVVRSLLSPPSSLPSPLSSLPSPPSPLHPPPSPLHPPLSTLLPPLSSHCIRHRAEKSLVRVREERPGRSQRGENRKESERREQGGVGEEVAER